MRFQLAMILAFCGGTAAAQEQQFLSSDGVLFTFKENRHGAVLTASDPASNTFMTDIDAPPAVAPGEVIYLGRSCDAFSRTYGDGSWVRANGSFLVEFGRLRVAFPGQQIDLVSDKRCQS